LTAFIGEYSFASKDRRKCGAWGSDQAENTKGADKAPFLVVAGPGFEPGEASASKCEQVLSTQDFKGFRKRKTA